MRKRLLRALAAGVTMLAVLGAPAAWAAPAQVDRAQVLQALGVEREASDYVVLVDVSGSMQQDDRYAKVRTALSGMLDALAPGDRVTLIAFADTADVRFRGTEKRGALAALPDRPTGAKTDIGAGIRAGVEQLSQPDALPSGVLALITDGTIDAPAGSPYATAEAPGWAALAQDAAALTKQRPLAAYAIGLGAETDAGVLATVFPDATMVPGEQIAAHLGRIDAELLNFKAAERLRADAGAAVRAEWAGLDAGALAATGAARPTLTLTSTLAAAPVEVSGLGVALGDAAASASGLPDVVTLAPGQAQSFPVDLAVTGLSAAGGSLVVRGAVDSPWREAAAAMGVPLAPRFEAAGVTLTPVRPELPIARPDLTPIIAAAAGALAAVLALVGLVVALLRRRPKLHGSLAIARQGATVREFVLDAPTVDLARAWPGSGLTGSLRPARSRDGAEAVKVVARSGGQKVRTVLRDDETVNVGELTLRWTAQRTRTLEMVNEGL